MTLRVVKLGGPRILRSVRGNAEVNPEDYVSASGLPLSPGVLARIEQFLASLTDGSKGFNEDAHPRAPAGSSDGGQFTSGGGGGGGSSHSNKPSSAFPLLNPGGLDSLMQHSDGKGHFTKERAALHTEIVAKFFGGTTRVDNPVATILGGGPGTGKSTLVTMEKIGGPNTVLINVDDIRAELPELKEGKPAAFTHEEASHVGKQLQSLAADGSRNLLLDGTGDSSLEKLGGKVAVMRAAGHTIVAEYVTTSVEIAQARADARAQRTGRVVPPTVLRETHAAVSRVFPEAVRQGLFDSTRLWDASGPKGSRPVLVMSAVGSRVKVHDQEKWDRFLAKGKAG